MTCQREVLNEGGPAATPKPNCRHTNSSAEVCGLLPVATPLRARVSLSRQPRPAPAVRSTPGCSEKLAPTDILTLGIVLTLPKNCASNRFERPGRPRSAPPPPSRPPQRCRRLHQRISPHRPATVPARTLLWCFQLHHRRPAHGPQRLLRRRHRRHRPSDRG